MCDYGRTAGRRHGRRRASEELRRGLQATSEVRIESQTTVFMAPSVIYFGLRFSEKGLQSSDEKVKGIKDAPKSVTKLLSSLGMAAALHSKGINSRSSPERAPRKQAVELYAKMGTSIP